MKKIQIDMDMFLDVYKLMLRLHDYELEPDVLNLCQSIETQIEAKIDAVARREQYTQYKTGETQEEREKARQKYLDMAGIHKDWRY